MKLSAEIEARLLEIMDRGAWCDVRTLICEALDEYRNELVEAFNARWRCGYGEMAQAYSIAADIIEDHIGRERAEAKGDSGNG